MTNSVRIGTIVTLLAHGVAGCNGSGHSPGPSPIPGPGIPAATTLVVFTESASGFSTTDLRTITDGNGRYRLDGVLRRNESCFSRRAGLRVPNQARDDDG
ncbi:hypothetical protein BH24ACI5_BH24ACI5_16880 [soil metagenome]